MKKLPKTTFLFIIVTVLLLSVKREDRFNNDITNKLSTVDDDQNRTLSYEDPDDTRMEYIDEKQTVTFLLYNNKECSNIREISWKYQKKKPSQTLDNLILTCAKNRLCQAVMCSGGNRGCEMCVPTCVLSNDVKSNNKSFVYVLPDRVGVKLNLKEKLLSDLRPLSQLRQDRPDGGQEYNKKDYQPFNSLNNTLNRLSSKPPFIAVTENDLRNMAFPRVMVEPHNRLVFFFVPKAASKSLIRLYDYLLGHRDVLLDGDDVIQLYSRFTDPHRERLGLVDLGLDVANQVMNDPKYRKIVFFRGIEERALSAYLFLFGKKSGRNAHKFGKRFMTFDDFLLLLKTNSNNPLQGTGPRADIHCKQQVLLGNIYKFLPLFDFIGWATEPNIKQMISSYTNLPPFVVSKIITPPKSHATNSASKLKKYLSSAKDVALLRAAYSTDVQFFNYLGLVEGGDPVNGFNFPPHNSFCLNDTQLSRQIPACWPGDVVNG